MSNLVVQKLLQGDLAPADLADQLPVDHILRLAKFTFINSLDNALTRQKYASILDNFTRFLSLSRQVNLLQATGLDITAWRQDLKNTGGVIGSAPDQDLSQFSANSPETIENKTSAISSFYSYLCKPGRFSTKPLTTYNPVDSLVSRHPIVPYGKSRRISLDAFKNILQQIPTSLSGLRDYCLYAGYYLTGLRLREWLNLRWGDININANPPVFTYTRKGGIQASKALPTALWPKIKHLAAALQANSATYLFTANNGSSPLDPSSVLYTLKDYAAKAGLNSKSIGVHSLRHLHATAALNLGINVEHIRASLKHADLNTTQIYASEAATTNSLANTLQQAVETSDDLTPRT